MFLVTLALGTASVRVFWAEIWRSRVARAVAALVLLVPALGFIAWRSATPELSYRGVVLAWTALVVLVPLAAALFVGGLARALFSLATRAVAHVRGEDARLVPGGLTRRALLRGAAVLPLGSVTGSITGLAEATTEQRLRVVRMNFPDLHPDLEGLRILQLSDLHLGVSFHAADLEAALVRAEAAGFDLLVLTGDVADNYEELEAALAIAARHAPRLGVYAALGNHEYLHDIDRVRPIYEASAVPLLVDQSVALRVGNASLVVAGADDPEGRPDGQRCLRESIEQCAAGAPSDAFRLLLCHRPDGFEAAAANGFHLTLSGHTHGGQIGFLGRSAFERLFPTRYLWGAYERGGARLYTTSGFGHWFPFRLECPTEMPLVVLGRG
jgi:predicted MPP superfamily phosphohydrolase